MTLAIAAYRYRSAVSAYCHAPSCGWTYDDGANPRRVRREAVPHVKQTGHRAVVDIIHSTSIEKAESLS